MRKSANTIKSPEMDIIFKDDNNKNDEKKSKIENTPEITVYITNISGYADLNCNLDFKEILKKKALKKYNPEIKNNFLKMKLNKKKPYAQFYSNGKIVCTGVKSEEKLKKAIIEFDNIIKSSGIYTNLNLDAIVISNISTTCDIKYKLRLQKLYSYLAELKDPEVKVYYNSEHYPAIIYKKK